MHYQEKEIEFMNLAGMVMLAKTESERDLAMKKLHKFAKENPQLVDEVQRSRWTDYG